MDGLARFLGAISPFCSLTEGELDRVAAAARIVDYPAGALIMDAFLTAGDDLFVIMSGEVEIWTRDAGRGDTADETLGRGSVLGHTTTLTGAAVGPRAVALGPVRLVAIPATVVASAFSSPDGVRFLAKDLAADRARRSQPRTVDDLVVSEPVVGHARMSVADAARLMTERGCGYVAVPHGDGEFGLVTDALLRERVLAQGLPGDTPVKDVMIWHARTARTGTPTADVIHELTEHHLDQLLVVDGAGRLQGAVDPQDFLGSQPGAVLTLRDELGRAPSIDDIVALSRQLPFVLCDLVRAQRLPSEVTATYATLLDALQRRLLWLVLRERPELSDSEVTWMELGSNGRREPTLGSDIDAAVVFAEVVVTEHRADDYRRAFAEMADILRRAGLRVDSHGATPAAPAFSRTRSQWRTAAERWIGRPLDDQGMLMASLLLDGRPIQGDLGRPVVNEVFADVRDHPATMKFLIRESLSHKAQIRSVRDVLAGRGGTFDLKAHALRPVVEIARWAALSVRSHELATTARLAAASGSMLLPAEQATILSEVFEVLQRVRLRQQVSQFERGEPVTDVITMRQLPPLDRSLVEQSVREISAVQKRLYNLLQYTTPQEWAQMETSS